MRLAVRVIYVMRHDLDLALANAPCPDVRHGMTGHRGGHAVTRPLPRPAIFPMNRSILSQQPQEPMENVVLIIHLLLDAGDGCHEGGNVDGRRSFAAVVAGTPLPLQVESVVVDAAEQVLEVGLVLRRSHNAHLPVPRGSP